MTALSRHDREVVDALCNGVRHPDATGTLLHNYRDLETLLAVLKAVLLDASQAAAADRIQASADRVKAAWLAKPAQVKAWHPLGNICVPNEARDLLLVLEAAEKYVHQHATIHE